MMKLQLSALVLSLLAALALAVESQKQVVISYPNDTPASVMEEAKSAIIEAVRRGYVASAWKMTRLTHRHRAA